MERPKDIAGFREWYAKEFSEKMDDRFQAYYDSVSRAMLSQVRESAFVSSLAERIQDCSDNYLLKTGYRLLTSQNVDVGFVVKPYKSFEEKIFRKNIVHNDNWPNQPEGGWYKMDDSFHRINDIVRATLVVKYLDGVELLCEQIAGAGKDVGWSAATRLEAREYGYYAAHADVEVAFSIPDRGWHYKDINGRVEIQVTTQLQDVLSQLTHKYYESRRLHRQGNEPEKKWQWDHRSEEFATNYLGHILHYLEGTILEVRDRRERNERV